MTEKEAKFLKAMKTGCKMPENMLTVKKLNAEN